MGGTAFAATVSPLQDACPTAVALASTAQDGPAEPTRRRFYYYPHRAVTPCTQPTSRQAHYRVPHKNRDKCRQCTRTAGNNRSAAPLLPNMSSPQLDLLFGDTVSRYLPVSPPLRMLARSPKLYIPCMSAAHSRARPHRGEVALYSAISQCARARTRKIAWSRRCVLAVSLARSAIALPHAATRSTTVLRACARRFDNMLHLSRSHAGHSDATPYHTFPILPPLLTADCTDPSRTTQSLLRYGGELSEVIRFIPHTQAYLRQLTFRTHNVCGLRDPTFRKSYLRHAKPDIIALLETNCCSADEETDWAKDWAGQAFFASQYRDIATQFAGSHRGVVILIADSSAFGKGRVIARDPDGRYLAILIPIHKRPTLIVAYHADCGSEHAGSFKRLQDALTVPPGTEDVHLLTDTNNHASSLDHISYSSAPAPLPAHQLQGAAALHTLTTALGGLSDAFRTLHPTRLEYTHKQRAGDELLSKSRIDRHYLSTHFTSGAAPRLISCTHHHPTSLEFRRVRGTLSHTTTCGDHAAVDTVIAYTDTPRPASTWKLPLHRLQDLPTVATIRALVSTSLTTHAHECPTARLNIMMADVKRFLKRTNNSLQLARTQRLTSLHAEIATCENALGEGIGPEYLLSTIADPITRATQLAITVERRDQIVQELDAIRAQEDRDWLIDRNYEVDVNGEACTRAFFERKRAAERSETYIGSLRTESTPALSPHATTHNHYREQHELNKAADRFYGSVKGGLYDLPFERDATAEAALHDALRQDGKVLPPQHATRLASFDNMINRETVRAAIRGMANGAVPGKDGFPTEFFKLFALKPRKGGDEARDEDDDESEEGVQLREANRVLDLLVEVYSHCHTRTTLPTSWNTSVTTLLHKKGRHDELANYRPISVCSVVYKVLARCLADSLQTALPWLLDDAQVACQEGKSCFANTRYVQDLIHYCDTEDMSGLLVFCDATKAFDRVQHGYLRSTMQAMQIPDAFVSLYTLLITGATTQVKVNGYLGRKIPLRNGVRQGDPCSPLVYLLSLQPLLSMLRLSQRVGVTVPLANGRTVFHRIKGIPIPTLDGTATDCALAVAMADDVALALQDTHQLPAARDMMCVHERASGSNNNWPKTFGLRIGSLRGSTALPFSWNPAHINFDEDPIRYLGVFLGCSQRVTLKWAKDATIAATAAATDLTSRMTRRFEEWAALGVGTTYAGRNLIVKNSVLAMAWYLVESQTIETIDAVLTNWQTQAWRFVEATCDALRLSISTGTSAHRIARLVLVQDYAEGGRRCLDVEYFSRALRVRAVRNLFEPAPHPYKCLAFHWIRASYAGLALNPHQLLLSNCDFTHLHDSVPTFWREVLRAWGCEGDGLHPATAPDKSTEHAYCPQVTYQEARPLPPFDDGLWHRSPSPRVPKCPNIKLTLGACLSLPLGYSPILPGCLNGPVRDAHTDHYAQHTRDRATRVHLTRPMTTSSVDAAYDLRVRLERLAQRGITHIFHLCTGWAPGEIPRLRTVSELSSLHTAHRDRLPRWICEEALLCVPPFALPLIQQAAALRHTRPNLSLAQLCQLSHYPAGTYVRLPCGHVCAVAPPTPITPEEDLELAAAYVARPDTRLVPVPDGVARPMRVSRALAEEVQVWSTTRMAHCQEQRDYESRNADTIQTVLLCAGPSVDRRVLFGTRCSTVFANPALLSLAYGKTDRKRCPFPVATMDVYSLYHRALSYRHVLPRTLDPTAEVSPTSSSFAHLLTTHTDSSTLEQVRLSVCQASHPNAVHGRREAHELYLTVNDGRPIGNARCSKQGPTHAHCDICYQVDGVLRRETTAHVVRDCPYAQLVLDAVLREVVSLYQGSDDNDNSLYDGAALLPAAALLDTYERLYITGSCINTPLPAAVASNLAGCISRVLFQRAAANAPRPSPRALQFSPHHAYASVISLLCERAAHTFRYARSLDDRLSILHPGIEPWLEEHGHVPEWRSTWGKLMGESGDACALPRLYAGARVGNSGARGVPLLATHTCARLATSSTVVHYRGPLPAPCLTRVHVCVRLSVGVALGVGRGDAHVPPDPLDNVWPRPVGATPEYAVEEIVAERTVRGETRYQVKWLNYAIPTWEPATHLAGTAALHRWLLQPGTGAYAFVMRGDLDKLDQILSYPGIPPSRLHVFRNLRAAMDSQGVARFERRYPNSAGGITGGRATYYDTRKKGNTFLSCPAIARTFIYGALYDEIDISRSHFSALISCHLLTGDPRPITLLRYRAEAAILEADIEREMCDRRSTFETELALLQQASGGVPNQRQRQLISSREWWIETTRKKAKTIFSTLINIHNPHVWHHEFNGCDTFCQTLSDIQRMKPSLLRHPLCVAYVQALTAAGTGSIRLHSLCLAHLDEHALHAARVALQAADVLTGLTVNDSLTIYRPTVGLHSNAQLLRKVTEAAEAHLGYHVAFKYLPHLRDAGTAPPSLQDVVRDAGALIVPVAPRIALSPSQAPSNLDYTNATVDDDSPPLGQVIAMIAPSRSSFCRACRSSIALGTVRVGRSVALPLDLGTAWEWLHPRCWTRHTGLPLPAAPPLSPVILPGIELGDTGAGCLPPSARLRGPLPARPTRLTPAIPLPPALPPHHPTTSPEFYSSSPECYSSTTSPTPATTLPGLRRSPVTRRAKGYLDVLPPAPYYLPIPNEPADPRLFVPIHNIHLPSSYLANSPLAIPSRPLASYPSAFRRTHINQPPFRLVPSAQPLRYSHGGGDRPLYRCPIPIRPPAAVLERPPAALRPLTPPCRRSPASALIPPTEHDHPYVPSPATPRPVSVPIPPVDLALAATPAPTPSRSLGLPYPRALFGLPPAVALVSRVRGWFTLLGGIFESDAHPHVE